MKNGDSLEDLVGWEYHGYPLKGDSTMTVLGIGKIKPNKHGNPDAPDHAMVMYTAKKGNFVFNAGTCFWSLPLSKPPGYQNPVNNQGELGKEVIDFTKAAPRIHESPKICLIGLFNSSHNLKYRSIGQSYWGITFSGYFKLNPQFSKSIGSSGSELAALATK